MLAELATILSPYIASWLTDKVKKLRTLEVFAGTKRKSVIRVVLALLSLVVVVGKAVLTGGEVDVASVQTLLETVATALGAAGIYHIGKK